MKILTGRFRFLKNKYLLAGTFFVVWMLFFDPNDWGVIVGRIRKLHALQESETRQNRQIAEARKELSLLKTNAETIVKYAREKYQMKKDNEDLFIVNSP